MSAGKKGGGGGASVLGVLVAVAALLWLYHDPDGFQSFVFLLLDRVVRFARNVSEHFHLRKLVSP